ncbi:MAG: hypothetical protein HYR73_00335 [Candidatus Eisenbacteria bacterium]|nr:hypothetical protein [Candidatus Eisenbacteria bacterium]
MILRPLAATLLGLAAALSARADPALPTLDPSGLHAGQKAEVRTVFSGHAIETFEAEILGVLSGGRAEGDLILARATSERVIRSGVAQGMSGSPVYVDGRLIGALSSGWTFSREPIFGITPIGDMLRVLDLPASPDDRSGAGPVGVEPEGLSAGSRYREFRWPGDKPGAGAGGETPTSPRDAARDETQEARPDRAAAPAESNGLAPLALPLTCGGLHSAALEPARRLLAPLGFAVTPGGSAPGGGPGVDQLAPGSAVAVDLMRGDLQISAIGTVTWRDADRVLIFGHPFFQAGAVRMPLSTAEIVTIIPNEASSFKLGMPGREVGVATQDRRAAVAGTLAGRAPMLPLSVRIAPAGRPPQPFRFRVLEDRALAPSLTALAALNSLLESGGTGAGQTLRWSVRMTRAGAPPLVLHDLATGDGATGELVSGISAPLRYLFNNPYRRLKLDSIAVEIETLPVREQWTLRGARLQTAAVRPGGRARVRCELERWRGMREIREIEIAVPQEAPGGRYLLWVGGGGELTRLEAQRLPAHFRPTSLDEAWRRLATSRSDDALYAVLFARAPEVTSEGRDYPELPPSALLMMSSGMSSGERGRRSDFASLDERRVPLEAIVQGETQIELMVDVHAP